MLSLPCWHLCACCTCYVPVLLVTMVEREKSGRFLGVPCAGVRSPPASKFSLSYFCSPESPGLQVQGLAAISPLMQAPSPTWIIA